MDWTNFLDYGYPAIMSGIIAYLFQRWYSHKFDKKLKSFENELETLKEKNVIKFDALHKNRIDIIKKLNSMICAENDLVLAILMPSDLKKDNSDFPDDIALIKNFTKHKHGLELYLYANSIYLPKIVVDRFIGVSYSLTCIVESVINDDSEENKKRLVDHYHNNNVKKLFDDLINEIRDLLGVEESDYETNHIKK